MPEGVAVATLQAGVLTVEIRGAYNYVVDSNVESPSSAAPSVATIGVLFCNTGGAALNDVTGHIGDHASGTPGLYPARDSGDGGFQAQHPHLADTGLYFLTHVGGKAGVEDASRYIGVLQPGECKVQYWHHTYPRRANPDNTGVAVWGETNDPNDGLWLRYDVWATSAEGSSANQSRTVTMRNEISAMANKIEPSGGTWFTSPTGKISPGSVITSNGIQYDLGVINTGFDNDGSQKSS